MAEIEDIDLWFAEFKGEMINLLHNFSGDLTASTVEPSKNGLNLQ